MSNNEIITMNPYNCIMDTSSDDDGYLFKTTHSCQCSCGCTMQTRDGLLINMCDVCCNHVCMRCQLKKIPQKKNHINYPPKRAKYMCHHCKIIVNRYLGFRKISL